MSDAEAFVALLIAVVLAALAVRRVEGVPDAVGLVVGGLLPFAPEVRLDPQLIFVVFLPPILYPSAFTFALEDVRANLRPIGFLAFGLVLATVGAVAVMLHLAAGTPWAASCVLGAVLAPTDPVAATAVIRSSGATPHLATTLEGESLINDGTSLTALKIAISAVGGSFSIWSSVGQFALIALGGAAVGATLAWLASRLRRRLDDLELESAIAVLLAYGTYLLAERLEVSGVLAVVFAGYVMGRTDLISTPGTRMGGESFWSVTRFLAESILFLLVGIAFAQVISDPAGARGWRITELAAAAVATSLGIRLAWMFSVPYLAGLLKKDRRALGAVIGPRERVVVSAGGLRGALSVAAALSIPSTVDSAVFPDRSTIVAVAIASIVVLLVVPALSLGRVLAAVGLAGPADADAGDTERRRARAALAEAALHRTDDVAARGYLDGDLIERTREHYVLQLQRSSADAQEEEAAGAEERAAAYRRLRREALQAQRRRLLELRRAGEISGSLVRDLERDLDLEELRIR